MQQINYWSEKNNAFTETKLLFWRNVKLYNFSRLVVAQLLLSMTEERAQLLRR